MFLSSLHAFTKVNVADGDYEEENRDYDENEISHWTPALQPALVRLMVSTSPICTTVS